jgi:uncharacterized protein (TIGR02421 family)
MTSFTPVQQMIFDLSERIVKAQQPIRILDAIKWDINIKNEFFKHKFRKLPEVDQAYYERNPLGFDPEKKIDEFYIIEHEIKRDLGKYGAASTLMQNRCREYRDAVQLLQARGTHQFSEIAQDLYGSSQDAFYPGAPTLKDLSQLVNSVLINIGNQTLDKKDENIYTADDAVNILTRRLSNYFGADCKVQVKTSDTIISDASAGADTIKLRSDAKFSERVIRLYEVHEGWVHLGTTFNGLLQPICTFLSKGPPSSTLTQEGLGMLTEIFSFSSYPDRVKRLTNRIIAINMAEEGANFIEVFNFFREQGLNEEESYYYTVRVFRGSTPTQGPFTKDLAYSKGFILAYNYIRLCIQRGNLKNVPLLFAGKTALKEIHLLAELLDDDTLKYPKYIPKVFGDLAAVSAWTGYSLFLNRVNVNELAKDFRDIL